MEMERSDEFAEEEVEDNAENNEFRPDWRPEYCRYRDEGCELHSACLSCPLARCIYEKPRGKQQRLLRMRGRKIAKLFIKGKRIRELAKMFRVSERTVQRALRENL